MARALLDPWSIGRPPTQHACRAVRTWRGCVVAQRGARSSPCRRPGLDCTNIVTGRRYAFEIPWSAHSVLVLRGPRAFCARECRPSTHGACVPRSADRAWLCCRPMRGALLPTPSAGARPHQHHDRTVVRVTARLSHRFRTPWSAARARFCLWSIGRPPAEHARRAVCTRHGRVVAQTQSALSPTLSARAQLHQHRDRSVARSSQGRHHCAHVPWCVARVLLTPWSIGRPPTKNALHSVYLAWLCCGPTRGTLLPTPSAGARLHKHRYRRAARSVKVTGRHICISYRAVHAIFTL